MLILKRLLERCLICLGLFLGYSYGFFGCLHSLVPGSHLKYEFSLYVLNVGPYLLAHCDLLLNRINGRSLRLFLRGLSETGRLCLESIHFSIKLALLLLVLDLLEPFKSVSFAVIVDFCLVDRFLFFRSGFILIHFFFLHL
jgi:hypothetical protein